MNKLPLFTAAIIAATIISSPASSQDVKERVTDNKSEKSQEIIIRKKGDKPEKMTIVVDGDNVTINGKPASDFKDEVSVLERTRPFPPEPPVRNFRGYSSGGTQNLRDQTGRDMRNFNLQMNRNINKALLGVMTSKTNDGVAIEDVTKESGAEKAGLQKGDIITKVGSTPVAEPGDLIKAVKEYKPNDKVDISYKRNGKENKTTVTLGENKTDINNFDFNFNNEDFNFPKPPVPPLENFNFSFNRKPKIGLQIQDVEEGKGVTVKDVDDDSPAAKAGMKEGDIITRINGKDISGVDDLREQIRDAKEGDTIKFDFKRGGKNESSEIKIPKRLKSADL